MIIMKDDLLCFLFLTLRTIALQDDWAVGLIRAGPQVPKGRTKEQGGTLVLQTRWQRCECL
jgi:hypothetical protein